MDHFTNQSKCLHTAPSCNGLRSWRSRLEISEWRALCKEGPCSHWKTSKGGGRRKAWHQRGVCPIGSGAWKGELWGVLCQESLQVMYRSPPVPLNPSWQNIWPPGPRVAGPLTQRVPGWKRSAPEPSHGAPQGTQNFFADPLGFAQRGLTLLSGNRSLPEQLEREDKALSPRSGKSDCGGHLSSL